MNKKVYVGIYVGCLGVSLLLGAIAVILAIIAENLPNARAEIQNIMAPIFILAAIVGFAFYSVADLRNFVVGYVWSFFYRQYFRAFICNE